MKKRNGLQIMAELVKLVKPLLHIMLITISMGIVGFLCSIFITILGGFALLNVFGLPTGFSTTSLLVTVAILAILRGALRYAEQASGHYIAFRLLAIIRDKVFQALRKLAPAKLEGKEKGNLISIITSDIELLEVFYAHTIAPVTIGILTSALMVWFIGSYDLSLGILATIAYLVVGYVIPKIISKIGSKDGKEYRDQFGELNSYLLDSLRGLRETIQYDDGENRLNTIKEKSDRLDEKQRKLKSHEGLQRALTDSSILFFSLAMLILSVHLYAYGVITFNGAFICTIAMFSSFGPVVALANLSNNLLQTLASGERVLAILEETPEVEEVTDGEELEFDGVKVNDLAFSYGEEEILKDFNVTIEKNRITGIIGKSGSGKSTFLKLLMRFWDKNEGEILYSGKDVKEYNTSSLRKNIAYVTQETYLFKETIEENIRISRPEATREEVMEAAKKASIHDFILSLPNGYDTKVSDLGESLSGGERQRIGIARAFLHNAPLILLDEPTSNLDSINEAIILKSIHEECKDKTVVLVSHRKSTMNIVHNRINVGVNAGGR